MTNVEKLNKIAELSELLAKKDKRVHFVEVKEIYESLLKIKDLCREVIFSIEQEGDYNPSYDYDADLEDLFREE